VNVLAVISQPEVVDKILAHVGLPVEPDVLADGCTLAFDVTGEPIPEWAEGTNPQSELHGLEPNWTEASLLAGVQAGRRAHVGDSPRAHSQRGPPCAFEGVDPPCPDEVFGE
jgi:hypothetical protein